MPDEPGESCGPGCGYVSSGQDLIDHWRYEHTRCTECGDETRWVYTSDLFQVKTCTACAEKAAKAEADPAVAKKLDDLEKSIAALTEKFSKTAAAGAPHTGAGVDLSKTAAIPEGLEAVVNTAPVVTH